MNVISHWQSDLLPYCRSCTNVFSCPAWTTKPSGWGPNDYGYNVTGTGVDPASGESLGLGPELGYDDSARPISGEHVMVPADMLAIGDLGDTRTLGDMISPFPGGFGWPGPVGSNHTDRRSNAVFCDGYVEIGSSDLIPQRQNRVGQLELPSFKPDAARAKRWNSDNQPHPETWPY